MPITVGLFYTSSTFKRFAFFPLFALLIHSVSAQTARRVAWGNWTSWGAQPDGFYRNPILPADYSDIDCIRVGDGYYSISSTFQYCPGVVILKSSNLVNWRIIGHAVDQTDSISTAMDWTRMTRYGRGIWAGAIRFHKNKFWIYFGTPDEGYFATFADHPEGPWSPLRHILAGSGWDDCCPFWDDDGQGYLVGTNFSENYRVHLFKLAGDGLSLDRHSDVIIHQSNGSEANKLYKVRGWYYHLFSEVKPEGRVLMMERSKKIAGPYLESRQLMHANRQANEPNQGGLVETPSGSWYFLTHHGTGDWSGRAMSLMPVTWIEDWPVIGTPGADGIGNMSWSGKIPDNIYQPVFPPSRDEFDSVFLRPEWEWNYQPRKNSWSLTERPGWLRLHANRPLKKGKIHTASNTITQRVYRTRSNTVVTRLDLTGMSDGEHAGLAQYGFPAYAGIGIVCSAQKKYLEFRQNDRTITGEPVNGNSIWLKTEWGLEGKSLFFYSFDGILFKRSGPPWPMKWETYRGSRLAIYNFNDSTDNGFVDIDFLHYDFR